MVLEVPGITTWTTAIGAVIAILSVLAGLWVFNRLIQRALFDIQDRTIAARKEENDALRDEVVRLTKTVASLQRTMTTLGLALKQKYGIEITVDGELVTFVESGVRKRVTVRVRQPTVVRHQATDAAEGTIE